MSGVVSFEKQIPGFFKLMLEIKNYDSEKIRTSQLDKFYYDINYCHQNNINIRASSGAINDKMLKNLKNF